MENLTHNQKTIKRLANRAVFNLDLSNMPNLIAFRLLTSQMANITVKIFIDLGFDAKINLFDSRGVILTNKNNNFKEHFLF